MFNVFIFRILNTFYQMDYSLISNLWESYDSKIINLASFCTVIIEINLKSKIC